MSDATMSLEPLKSADEISRQLGAAGRTAIAELAWAAVDAAVGRPSLLADRLARTPRVALFGAFVTLAKGGALRGCIGSVGRIGAAGDLVADAARAAAVHDQRFPVVTADELPQLTLEVSLLTPVEWLDPETLPGAVNVGEHGLVIERPPHRGLLLPQVATAWGWDAGRFLDETCRKAGLPAGAWRSGARVGRFAALIIPAGAHPETKE